MGLANGVWGVFILANFDFPPYFGVFCKKNGPKWLMILKVGGKIWVHQGENPLSPICVTRKVPHIQVLVGLWQKLWTVSQKLCQLEQSNMPLPRLLAKLLQVTLAKNSLLEKKLLAKKNHFYQKSQIISRKKWDFFSLTCL